MEKDNNKQEAVGNVSELSDLLDGMIPAKELINISFPECSKQCAAVDYFGVCECESVCPQKFDEAGRSISI